MTVEVDGEPEAVKWFKDGKEVPANLANDLGNGKYSLEIPECKAEDFGRYTVQVSNKAGEASSSGNVSEKGDKPQIVQPLASTKVPVGDEATFTVKVKGPVKQVNWYKNGNEIPDAQTKQVDPETYSLVIPDAQKDDAADYKVREKI